MMVVIRTHFCGFTINFEAVLCHILCIYYKTNFLKSHGTGYRYFKGKSTVNLDIFCCEKAVALPKKKIIIIRKIWRFLGMKPFQRNVIS